MKPEHKPLAAYRVISILSSLLLVASFVLLLLIGISLPIVKSVYIIRIYATTDGPATSIATELRFGVWGVCALSAFDERSWFSTSGNCFGPRLGYEIPSFITSLVGISDDIADIITTSLLAVLILHLVAAGVALVTCFSSLFLASRVCTICSLFLAVVSAIITTIMFFVDLAVVIIMRDQLPQHTNGGFAVEFGNAVWMALAAMIATWISVVLLSARACFCCGIKRKHKF